MKNIFLPLSFFIAIFFCGCSHDETTVQVLRTPILKFDFNATSSWKAENYSLSNISKAVVYPEDTTQAGQLFNRFKLQGSGKDSAGNTYQLIVTFDALDINQLVGIYSTVYTAQRGLSEVELFNLTNSNDLSAYSLCQENRANAIFQIQKQKLDERIITGTFQMTLCNERDTTQKINIINGIIKDIKY